jgi:3-oxoisoapionate kinase
MTTEPPFLAWYGDDFTGAAAVMEVLEFAGYPAVLFVDPPDAAMLANFPGRFAVGVAGDARTRGPDWMDAHLPGMFGALRATGARILHYKACSTMDSAPAVGSIGRAADLGLAAGDWAPLIFAAPALGRWQAFGNLFARAPDGIARLDRHPTMRHHPVTPMDEADVRLHLARQTDLCVGVMDVTMLAPDRVKDALAQTLATGARIVAFDIIDQASLTAVGHVLWQEAEARPLFAIGSQGVEYALAAARPRAQTTPNAIAVRQVVVLSGSASPDTAQQMAAAEMQGFVGVRVDAAAAVDRRTWQVEQTAVVAKVLSILAAGGSPIIFTTQGPDDPAMARTLAARAAAGLSPQDANLQLGQDLGAIIAQIVDQAESPRVVIAGGDTSSQVTRSLGITALTALARIAPGAPLLAGHRPDRPPLELVLKGGQMGAVDFFISTRDGIPLPTS